MQLVSYVTRNIMQLVSYITRNIMQLASYVTRNAARLQALFKHADYVCQTCALLCIRHCRKGCTFVCFGHTTQQALECCNIEHTSSHQCLKQSFGFSFCPHDARLKPLTQGHLNCWLPAMLLSLHPGHSSGIRIPNSDAACAY